MRFLLPLLLSLALLSAGPAQAQIERKVSEITEAERLVSKSMRNLADRSYPGHASFRAEYENPPEAPPIWRLSFFGFAEDTTAMTQASSVQLQADGQAITPLNVESRTRQLEDSLVEIKEATFSRSDFATLATVSSVSVDIGSVHFEMTRPLREDLRLILDRVPSDEGPRTASTEDSASTQ